DYYCLIWHDNTWVF
nr:immunoglobulin light chain junction region [Macaca mulatta]MOY09492.1 immunoglobulin light chain junction region [Macaca mulatta]